MAQIKRYHNVTVVLAVAGSKTKKLRRGVFFLNRRIQFVHLVVKKVRRQNMGHEELKLGERGLLFPASSSPREEQEERKEARYHANAQ